MRKFLISLLPVLFCAFAHAEDSASTVVLKPVAGHTVEQYLNYYLLAKIPIAQFKFNPSTGVSSISGQVTFDVHRLPLRMQDTFKAAVLEIMDGVRTVPGAILDFSSAKIEFLDSVDWERAEQEAVEAKVVKPGDGFIHAPVIKPNTAPGHAYDAVDVDPHGYRPAWSSCHQNLGH